MFTDPADSVPTVMTRGTDFTLIFMSHMKALTSSRAQIGSKEVKKAKDVAVVVEAIHTTQHSVVTRAPSQQA